MATSGAFSSEFDEYLEIESLYVIVVQTNATVEQLRVMMTYVHVCRGQPVGQRTTGRATKLIAPRDVRVQFEIAQIDQVHTKCVCNFATSLPSRVHTCARIAQA